MTIKEAKRQLSAVTEAYNRASENGRSTTVLARKLSDAHRSYNEAVAALDCREELAGIRSIANRI